MELIIELPYDLESQLREQAQQKGKALNQYITAIIREKVNASGPKTSVLTTDETLLFQIINKGFPSDFWAKLSDLDRKRQEAILTEVELQELQDMTNIMEAANVDRMKAVIELAKIRQIDLDTLMTQLGLTNGKHI